MEAQIEQHTSTLAAIKLWRSEIKINDASMQAEKGGVRYPCCCFPCCCFLCCHTRCSLSHSHINAGRPQAEIKL